MKDVHCFADHTLSTSNLNWTSLMRNVPDPHVFPEAARQELCRLHLGQREPGSLGQCSQSLGYGLTGRDLITSQTLQSVLIDSIMCGNKDPNHPENSRHLDFRDYDNNLPELAGTDPSCDLVTDSNLDFPPIRGSGLKCEQGASASQNLNRTFAQVVCPNLNTGVKMPKDSSDETESRCGSTESRCGSTESRYGSTESRCGSTESRCGSTESRCGSTESRCGSTEDGGVTDGNGTSPDVNNGAQELIETGDRYEHHLEFALKCGYKESDLDKVITRCGLDCDRNRLLQELVKNSSQFDHLETESPDSTGIQETECSTDNVNDNNSQTKSLDNVTVAFLDTKSRDSISSENSETESSDIADNSENKFSDIADNSENKSSNIADNSENKSSDIADNSENKSSNIADNSENKSSDIADNSENKSSDVADNSECNALDVADGSESKFSDMADISDIKSSNLVSTNQSYIRSSGNLSSDLPAASDSEGPGIIMKEMKKEKTAENDDRTAEDDDKTDNLRHIIIDGSNVAMSHGKSVFSCRGIQLAVDWFRRRGHRDITVFVPQWRKESSRPDSPITDQSLLLQLEREGVVAFTPARRVKGRRVVCYDDRFVLNLAVETDGVVVSNDNYRDLVKENEEYRSVVDERLLMYTFVSDRFMPPEDPLGRRGPTLDNFLNKGCTGDQTLQAECPYGPKCTYGFKCKYQHPERGPQPHKPVSELLKEQAAVKLQERNLRVSELKNTPTGSEHSKSKRSQTHCHESSEQASSEKGGFVALQQSNACTRGNLKSPPSSRVRTSDYLKPHIMELEKTLAMASAADSGKAGDNTTTRQPGVSNLSTVNPASCSSPQVSSPAGVHFPPAICSEGHSVSGHLPLAKRRPGEPSDSGVSMKGPFTTSTKSVTTTTSSTLELKQTDNGPCSQNRLNGVWSSVSAHQHHQYCCPPMLPVNTATCVSGPAPYTANPLSGRQCDGAPVSASSRSQKLDFSSSRQNVNETGGRTSQYHNQQAVSGAVSHATPKQQPPLTFHNSNVYDYFMPPPTSCSGYSHAGGMTPYMGIPDPQLHMMGSDSPQSPRRPSSSTPLHPPSAPHPSFLPPSSLSSPDWHTPPPSHGLDNPTRYGDVNPTRYGDVNPTRYGDVNPTRYGDVNPTHYGDVNPTRYGDVNQPQQFYNQSQRDSVHTFQHQHSPQNNGTYFSYNSATPVSGTADSRQWGVGNSHPCHTPTSCPFPNAPSHPLPPLLAAISSNNTLQWQPSLPSGMALPSVVAGDHPVGHNDADSRPIASTDPRYPVYRRLCDTFAERRVRDVMRKYPHITDFRTLCLCIFQEL